MATGAQGVTITSELYIWLSISKPTSPFQKSDHEPFCPAQPHKMAFKISSGSVRLSFNAGISCIYVILAPIASACLCPPSHPLGIRRLLPSPKICCFLYVVKSHLSTPHLPWTWGLGMTGTFSYSSFTSESWGLLSLFFPRKTLVSD